MNITPNKLTIAQLFATPNEQFIVPSYQRRYAWGHNQYMALYEDIDMLKENDGHLFGMIILHTSYHTAGINQPELVDGQQRLTTLIILLKAFEVVLRDKGKIEKAGDIKKMIICKGLDDIEKPKIRLGDLDNCDIESLLMKSHTEGITNQNIKNAFENYKEWLMKLDIEKLNSFFYKLTNVAVIIRLDVGMAQDAYKLFETINNRGLKLTPTDIIKNFLLGHAAKINKDTTLERIKTLWSKIIINLDSLDSDDFLRQYLCSTLQRKISMSKLVSEFKKYYMKHVEQADLLGEYEYYQEADVLYDMDDDADIMTEDEASDSENSEELLSQPLNIIQFVENLENLSDMYKKISFAVHDDYKINRRIKNLNNILSKPAYIFLMHFLKEEKYDPKEKIAVMKYIETLMLRRHICEKRTGENDDIFSKMVAFIGQDDILKSVKDFVNENSHIPIDDEFAMMFPKHQFQGKLIDRAKYVLECIEYHKRGNTNELLVASNEEVHLEHIIPQTIISKKSKEEYGDWESYLGDKSRVKHRRYVNYIGNMTLLGEALNIQASNNPFTKKKASYRKSSFIITSDLASMSDFKFSQVDKRGEELVKIALEIWKG